MDLIEQNLYLQLKPVIKASQHLAVVHKTIVDKLIFAIWEWDNELFTCIESLCFSASC